ncbi:MAG: DNA alkylation repair protein [Saprospiraceae bacterium]|nr:DNA alkylation repair protein [Saprospiraceae bacterium]
MQSIVKGLITDFKKQANPEMAAPMKSYMKNKFPFFGIKAVPRRAITAVWIPEFKKIDKEERQEVIEQLWQQPQRECHYAALDLAGKIIKQTDLSWLSFWEDKIIRNSWWDTVDFIAPSLIGPLLIGERGLQEEYAWKWMESRDLWLKRAAIVFQLKYKEQTNETLLYEIILANADSREFFIRKGCGWALREYGKSRPLSVSSFIHDNQEVLSNLTIKEGLRRLSK